MYVFNYDPATWAYTGGTPCDFDQLTPGEIIAPAWSTKTPPPRDWDNSLNWPHYRPRTDDWELRPLPGGAEAPKPTPVEPTAGGRTEALQATLTAHLEAAQRLMVELKKTVGEGA